MQIGISYERGGTSIPASVEAEFIPRVGEKVVLADMEEGDYLEVLSVTHKFQAGRQIVHVDATYKPARRMSDFFD